MCVCVQTYATPLDDSMFLLRAEVLVFLFYKLALVLGIYGNTNSGDAHRKVYSGETLL